MSLEDAVALARSALDQTRRVRQTDRGRELTADCPFHESKNRISFSLNLDTGMWLCRAGCGAGWIDSLLRKLGHSDERIRSMLNGVTKPRTGDERVEDPRRRAHLSQKEVKYLPEEILGLFNRCPTDLVNDGWPEEVLYRFEVGYDQGAGRIIYPVRDEEAKLRLIIGRSPYKGVTPPHKVYTKADLYEYAPIGYVPDKKPLLFNSHRVLQSAKKGDLVPICEGFKEIMNLWRVGYEGLSLMGAIWAKQQMSLLNRIYYSTRCTFVVLLDNDETGHRQGRLLCRALYKFTRPRIAFTEEVKDVGDLKDMQKVAEVIEQSRPYINRRMYA